MTTDVLKVSGDYIVEATNGNVTVDAPLTVINGNLTVTGTITTNSIIYETSEIITSTNDSTSA